MRLYPAALLVLLPLLSPAAAAAESPPRDAVEQARQAFEGGKLAYEKGQYVMAAAAFEEAYQLSPRAPILFSLAQTYRRQYMLDQDFAKLRRAVELYRRYLEEVASGGRRGDAQQILSELTPTLERLELERKRAGMDTGKLSTSAAPSTRLMVYSNTPGALVSLDGQEPSEVPLMTPVSPGNHKIRVEAPGFFAEEIERLAAEGALTTIEVNLREVPAKITLKAPEGAEVSIDGRTIGEAPLVGAIEVTPGDHLLSLSQLGTYGFKRSLTLSRGEQITIGAELETTRQRKLAHVVLGTAGALFAGCVVSGVLALGAEARAYSIEERGRRQNISAAELADHNSMLDRSGGLSVATAAFGIGAAAATAVGALLYLMDTPSNQFATGGD